MLLRKYYASAWLAVGYILSCSCAISDKKHIYPTHLNITKNIDVFIVYILSVDSTCRRGITSVSQKHISNPILLLVSRFSEDIVSVYSMGKEFVL